MSEGASVCARVCGELTHHLGTLAREDIRLQEKDEKDTQHKLTPVVHETSAGDIPVEGRTPLSTLACMCVSECVFECV